MFMSLLILEYNSFTLHYFIKADICSSTYITRSYILLNYTQITLFNNYNV